MARAKRVVNIPVRDSAQMLEIMKRLGTLDADLEAETRPGLIRIVLHGSSAEVQDLELKIKDFIKAK